MAGGVANDIRAPYPKGADALIPLKFGPFEIQASKTADFIVEKLELPFACYPVKAKITAQDITVTNAITVNLQDDSGTPNQIVTNQAPTAITAGAGNWEDLTLASGAKSTQLNAGALIECSYGSGVSDTGTDVTIILYVKPAF